MNLIRILMIMKTNTVIVMIMKKEKLICDDEGEEEH